MVFQFLQWFAQNSTSWAFQACKVAYSYFLLVLLVLLVFLVLLLVLVLVPHHPGSLVL